MYGSSTIYRILNMELVRRGLLVLINNEFDENYSRYCGLVVDIEENYTWLWVRVSG